jgi:hypothetical protein
MDVVSLLLNLVVVSEAHGATFSCSEAKAGLGVPLLCLAGNGYQHMHVTVFSCQNLLLG